MAQHATPAWDTLSLSLSYTHIQIDGRRTFDRAAHTSLWQISMRTPHHQPDSKLAPKTTPALVLALVLALVAATVIFGACNSQTATPAATTAAPATSITALTPPVPANQSTIAADPAQAQRQLATATPASQAIIAAAATGLGLEPQEAACVAQRLDTDPALRDALGANPIVSTRYGELAAIAQECIRTTTGAANFANSIAAQAGGTLPPETLDCLAESWANLSAEQTGNLTQAALNPGTVDPAARDTIGHILDTCHIDRTKLAQPPR